MEFPTSIAAYNLYISYVRVKGFSVRISSSIALEKQMNSSKTFICIKEGKKSLHDKMIKENMVEKLIVKEI